MKNLEIKNNDSITPCGNQSGRSMIEMLGVLAIIGVLSVGGIAGYSKAMMKYRINKTIEQITLIAGNVRTFFSSQRSYKDLSSSGSAYSNPNSILLKKAKLVPDEMWSGDGLVNSFGGSISIVPALKSENDEALKAFQIFITNIPQEACIDLLTQDWASHSGGGFIAIAIDGDGNITHTDTSVYEVGCSGKTDNSTYAIGCPNSTIGVPLPIDTAAAVCNSNSENNVISLYYY